MPNDPHMPTMHALAAYYSEGCSVRAAMAAVSEITGVSIAAMLGPSRVQHIARARQAAYLLARKSGASSLRIGRVMGRDHSTVIDGVRRAEKRLGCSVNA